MLTRRPSRAGAGQALARDPIELYNGACELALCWPIARNVAQKAALADEAMRALHAAVGAGWSDVTHTYGDPDLAPLHDDSDFQALIAALWEKLDRAMPADPFAPGLTPGPGPAPAASGR